MVPSILFLESNFTKVEFDEELRFTSTIKKSYQNSRDVKLLTKFRQKSSKFFWHCAACSKTDMKRQFNSLFSMRIFCLEHLSNEHSEENPDLQSLIDKEWKLLENETQFNLEELLKISKSRREMKNQSRIKFYTVDLKNYENGEKLEEYLKSNLPKQEEDEEVNYRLCLICFNLVEISRMDNHFRTSSHSCLESHNHMSIFFELPNVKIENIADEDDDLMFPRDIVAYCSVFKTCTRDMFKWRCCLCPSANAHTFVTFVVLRMYALRHIEENHKYLFLESFLQSEWNIIKSELRIGFDVRNYKPTLYTSRGENTFNPKNPNDYTLPQQYFFIPKNFVDNYLICGFCYKSFNKHGFIKHIVMHGFIEKQSQGLLKSTVYNKNIENLMEFSDMKNYQLINESEQILSKEGEKLKINLEKISERWSSMSNCSTSTTSREQPNKRRSAIEAKQLLSETFKIFKKNSKDKRSTWIDPMFTSSSSSDESSSDEYKDQNDKKRTTRRSTETMDHFDSNSERILEWIQDEARKRGVDYNFNNDSSDEDTLAQPVIKQEIVEIEEMEEQKPVINVDKPEKVTKSVRFSSPRVAEQTVKSKRLCIAEERKSLNSKSKYSSMSPSEVRQVIKNAAQERGIDIASTSSESESEPEPEENNEQGSIMFSKMTPSQLRLYLKIQAVSRGIQGAFEDSSSSDDSSDSSDDEDDKKEDIPRFKNGRVAVPIKPKQSQETPTTRRRR